MAQPNKNFEFNTWVESPLTNRNSSIPLVYSGNLTVNRYGVFTVNFKPLPPPIQPEYLYLIISVIVSSLIGWLIPSIIGWVKATQRKHLKDCINQIGKLEKNAMEEKIIEYYIFMLGLMPYVYVHTRIYLKLGEDRRWWIRKY
jgi:hypothetical protein